MWATVKVTIEGRVVFVNWFGTMAAIRQDIRVFDSPLANENDCAVTAMDGHHLFVAS